ncbi:MAG TPA: GFA family protein [Polyangiaceae bacterium]|nr:GFA family protein [Polyangiaceae bacterium]
MLPEVAGGCLCGAIRYRIAAKPLSVACCHCSKCRRASGAALVAWATFPKRALQVVGHPKRRKSSPLAERFFCAECGTQLFFAYVTGPATVDVTLGSLDDPNALQPSYALWSGDKPTWLREACTLPEHADNGPDYTPYHR